MGPDFFLEIIQEMPENPFLKIFLTQRYFQEEIVIPGEFNKLLTEQFKEEMPLYYVICG